MDKISLQDYIEKNIPVLKLLKFHIDELESGSVKVSAPFTEHINHQRTVFGGSISSLLILAGWARVKKELDTIDPDANVVIQSSGIRYIKPVKDDFTAVSPHIGKTDLEDFLGKFRRFGRAKISVTAHIVEGKKPDKMAAFEGNFAAFKS